MGNAAEEAPIVTMRSIVEQTDVWTTVLRLVALWVLYRVGLALYNISPFHPLYAFPGPRLAAASFIYEFWFDAVEWGKYTDEINRMHQRYGTVICRPRALSERKRSGRNTDETICCDDRPDRPDQP